MELDPKTIENSENPQKFEKSRKMLYNTPENAIFQTPKNRRLRIACKSKKYF
jgi:hypothetical protein